MPMTESAHQIRPYLRFARNEEFFPMRLEDLMRYSALCERQ